MPKSNKVGIHTCLKTVHVVQLQYKTECLCSEVIDMCNHGAPYSNGGRVNASQKVWPFEMSLSLQRSPLKEISNIRLPLVFSLLFHSMFFPFALLTSLFFLPLEFHIEAFRSGTVCFLAQVIDIKAALW